MKSTERERLAAVLAALDMNERNRIYKRASKLRKEEQKRRRRPQVRKRSWSEHDEGPSVTRTRTRAGTLEDWALVVLAQEEQEAGAHDPAAAGAKPAIVVHVERDHTDVVLDGERVTCTVAPTVRRAGVTVGDLALLERAGDGAVIRALMPRKTTLTRADPHNRHRERVLVANVDAVVVVASVKLPPLRTGMIDRFLIAIDRGGAQPILCANKSDLCDGDELAAELDKLAHYRERGVPIVCTSATTGAGLDELTALLAGRLAAFVGKSGVGKSSLLNAITPALDLATAEVRDKDGKGRHTTTSSTLHELPTGGAIIDTPGIRALGLGHLDAADLQRYFPEVAMWAGGCRFRDCSHSREPDCEVRQAVSDGRLDHERWIAYLRVLGVDEPDD